MNIKTGDILKPKEPDFLEEAYSVIYRVISIADSGITVEPVIDNSNLQKAKESMEDNIRKLFSKGIIRIPQFLDVNLDLKIDKVKEIFIFDFDLDDYEIIPS